MNEKVSGSGAWEQSSKPKGGHHEVTRVSPKLLAVATSRQSAGSSWGRLTRADSRTISKVSEASFSNQAEVATHSPTSRSNTTRPFSTNRTNSQMLTADSHSSLASFFSARVTLVESLSGASCAKRGGC